MWVLNQAVTPITIQIPKPWLIDITNHYSWMNCQNCWANGSHFDPKSDFEWSNTLPFSESPPFANRDTPGCFVLLLFVLWKKLCYPNSWNDVVVIIWLYAYSFNLCIMFWNLVQVKFMNLMLEVGVQFILSPHNSGLVFESVSKSNW